MATTLLSRSKWITVAALVVGLALASPLPGDALQSRCGADDAAAAPAVPLPKRAVIESLNLAFDYPADFVEGRYKHDPHPLSWLLNCALVFVEPGDAEGKDLERLKPGEFPSISVHPLARGIEAECLMTHVKPEWRCSIGGNIAYKLPCFPGLFGEGLHCYALPLPDGSAVMFMAPRRHSGEEFDIPTRYDWVIERMIASARPDRPTIADATEDR